MKTNKYRIDFADGTSRGFGSVLAIVAWAKSIGMITTSDGMRKLTAAAIAEPLKVLGSYRLSPTMTVRITE